MSKSRNPLRPRGARILLPVVALAAVAVGLPLYGFSKATPLHPQPERAPSVTHSHPSPAWDDSVQRARRVLRAGLAGQNLPGLSVAVGVDGDIVWAEGFGWSDVETRTPVTPETRFRIASASPVLTSAAVGLLLETGRLKLDEPVRTYLPDLPNTQGRVTLRQLMSHTGGLGTEGGDGAPLSRHRCGRPIEALPHVANDALLFEPGTQYRHSKYGWILVSAAIEAAAGRPFLAFMKDGVFRPLGMENTGAESAAKENPERVGEPEEDPPPFTLIRNLILVPLGIASANARPAAGTPATFYAKGFGPHYLFRHGVRVRPPRNLSCYAGAMAFFSTPSDLVRFGIAVNGGTVLQPSTVRLLQTPQRLSSGNSTGYGLGWGTETVTLAGGRALAVGHHGEWAGGTVVSLIALREAGVVVALTSNISHADTSALALQVADAFAARRGREAGARQHDR